MRIELQLQEKHAQILKEQAKKEGVSFSTYLRNILIKATTQSA